MDDGAVDDENAIDDAESDTYTPVLADAGMFLKAQATYNDRTYSTTEMNFSKTATSDATISVRTDPSNRPPEFTEGTATVRFVLEDTAAAVAIGAPVAATDSDGETPAYTLGGADMASFDIDATNGQLMTKAALDYETKRTYTVTITAADTSGESGNDRDTITVTIYVFDVDEAPTISTSGLLLSGSTSVEYTENGEGAVATYTAVGPDSAMAMWTLEGDDAGDFMIDSGGALTFRTPPDFEAATDADTDNVYMVTVEANDGTNTASRDVTVTVTDMDEESDIPNDINNDGMIDKSEVIAAFQSYIAGGIDKAQIIATFQQYIADSGS